MNQKIEKDPFEHFIAEKLRIVKDKLEKIKKLQELPQSHLTNSQKIKIEKAQKLLQALNFYENSLKLYNDFGNKISVKEKEYQNQIEKLKQENETLTKQLAEIRQEGNLSIHLRDMMRLYFLPSFTQSKESQEIELLNTVSQKIFTPKPRVPFAELVKSACTELNLYLEQSQDEVIQNYSYERLFYAVQKITQNDKFQNVLKQESKSNFDEKKVSWVDINDCLDDEQDENEKEQEKEVIKKEDEQKEIQQQQYTQQTQQEKKEGEEKAKEEPTFTYNASNYHGYYDQQRNQQYQQPQAYRSRGRYRKRFFQNRPQYNYYY